MARAENQDLVASLILRDQLSGPLAAAKGNLTATETSLGRLDATARAAGSSLGGFGASFGQIAKAGATAFVAFKAFDVASDFLGGSIKAFQEEERGIVRLTASLKANVPAWDGNVAAVESAVKANERYGFSDGEVRDSLALLVAATGDTAKAFELIATAQDLARLKGVSLADASQALVTIEAGRFRGLAQLGIELREGATQEEALAAVRAVAAGQAAAFGATTEGAMKDASVAVENLQEDIGVGLAPVVKDLAITIRTDVIPAIRDIGGAVHDIVGPLSDARVELAKWGISLPDFVPFIGDTQRMITLIKENAHATAQNTGADNGLTAAVAGLNAAQTQLQSDLTSGVIPTIEEYQRRSAALDAEFQALVISTDGFKTSAADAGRASLIASEQADRLNDSMSDLAKGFGAAGTAGVEAASDVDLLQTALDSLPREVTIDVTTRFFQVGAGAAAVGSFTPPPPEDTGNITQPLIDLEDERERERERKRQQAADAAAAAAKKRADELADAYKDKVSAAFDKARRTADTLFDALHDRHVKAIKDAETLAEKQHDAALQNISDALKVAQAGNAAPVNAAEKALRDRQEAQQRRDLVESQQRAQQALEANRDPAQTADLQRSLRAATEALQNFDAQAAIDRLKVVQTGLDAKAQGVADLATKEADAKLAAAKDQAQKDLDRETIANAKRKADFEVALAALEKKDIAAGKSPREIAADIAALQKKSGITIDPVTGFSHIDDPLVTAIKNVKIEPPKVTVVNNNFFKVSLNGREISAALSSGASPTAAAGTRTGGAGRS